MNQKEENAVLNALNSGYQKAMKLLWKMGLIILLQHLPSAL